MTGISGRTKEKMARESLFYSLGLLRTEMLESHCCLPDGRWHLSGGQAYGERWRFKGVEEVGEPQNAWRRGEGSYTR